MENRFHWLALATGPDGKSTEGKTMNTEQNAATQQSKAASEKLEMPNPTEADLASPEFEAIWQVIKSWDVNVPTHYEGYCGANGSHVKMILNALAAAT
ncbi:hypothetical protein [Pseudomonas sp. SDO55104_S430]